MPEKGPMWETIEHTSLDSSDCGYSNMLSIEKIQSKVTELTLNGCEVIWLPPGSEKMKA